MCGGVGFRSVSGEGSQFWVDVPVHDTRVRSSAPTPTRAEASKRVMGKGRRLVLCVEDKPANIALMKDLLSTFDNIDMLTAPTAETGIDLARGRQPQVVIMDINLPGMSGLDARALRDLPETKDIPVIALTAVASARENERRRPGRLLSVHHEACEMDELLVRSKLCSCRSDVDCRSRFRAQTQVMRGRAARVPSRAGVELWPALGSAPLTWYTRCSSVHSPIRPHCRAEAKEQRDEIQTACRATAAPHRRRMWRERAGLIHAVDPHGSED
ncbi:MAG TPA: response regulator [Polyangiaceae bacterium]